MESLSQDLEAYGYPLLKTKKSPEELILETIKSGQPRLIYALPIIIKNNSPRELDLTKLENHLQKEKIDKEIIRKLLYLSFLTYQLQNIQPTWRKKLKSHLKNFIRKKEFIQLKENFLRSALIEIKKGKFHLHIDPASFKDNFGNYLLLEKANQRKKLSEKIGLSLELKTHYHLSQLFSPKQKEIILKKLKKESLSKTEREYFSRCIKPKLKAILNPEIQKIGILLS